MAQMGLRFFAHLPCRQGGKVSAKDDVVCLGDVLIIKIE